jgi:flotillin
MEFAIFGALAGVLALAVFIALTLRRVVPTNEVHIVQSASKTISYGKDTGNGNTYYEWPSSIPFLGITKVTLPTSVFDLDLDGYEAYDKGRLPFVVDVKAFFRISDSNVAAQRVANFSELKEQLTAIVQGAVRTILASSDIEDIMQGRSTFGEQFTNEVREQLASWGVSTVKNIELMDIRDSKDSFVIKNIMDKKKSLIEMESRTEVAKNKRAAEIAEIEARREVDLQKQQATQAVGLRTIEAEREVAIQKQNALQLVKEQEKTTKAKEMEVIQVEQTRQAEIAAKVQLTKAAQDRDTQVITAEGKLEAARREAEAALEFKRREAEGISLEGKAKADAEKALQLAPVEAQITLAKEIGSNESYQKYLVTIRQVEATQAIGTAQAEALKQAEVKVIANTGSSPSSGLSNVMDLFSSKGGTELGAMLEGLAQTPKGQELIGKVLGTPEKPKSNGSAALTNGKGH